MLWTELDGEGETKSRQKLIHQIKQIWNLIDLLLSA